MPALGWCLLRGDACSGGNLLLGLGVPARGCLLWGACSWGVACSWGCLLWRGVPAPRWCACTGGGCLLLGVPAAEADPPFPHVNRMTDRCKNINLATTSLQPVKGKREQCRNTSICLGDNKIHEVSKTFCSHSFY